MPLVLKNFPYVDDLILNCKAISEEHSLIEILWETSENELSIRGLKWVHPKKIALWGR